MLWPYPKNWHRCDATALRGLSGRAFPSDEMPELTPVHTCFVLAVTPVCFVFSQHKNEMSFVIFVPLRSLHKLFILPFIASAEK